MESDLLPCPFCGNTDLEADQNAEALFDVCCQNCGASGEGFRGFTDGGDWDQDQAKAKAIIAWNTRHSPWQPIETAPKDGTPVDVWAEPKQSLKISGCKGRRFLNAYVDVHNDNAWAVRTALGGCRYLELDWGRRIPRHPLDAPATSTGEDMKLCHICGDSFDVVEVLEGFQTDEVKQLCYKCAGIVNKYVEKVHRYGEDQATKCRLELGKRHHTALEALKDRQASRFLNSLRQIYKRLVAEKGFSIVKPPEKP